MKSIFDKLRMFQWLIITAALAVAVYYIAPEQLQVGVWKLLLTTAAAYVGYWIDRLLFPYARPHVYIEAALKYRASAMSSSAIGYAIDSATSLAAASLLRRAIIIAAVILGVALGV